MGSERWQQLLRSLWAWAIGAVVVANLLYPLGVILTDPNSPWDAFEGEESPINWFSSVQCAVLGTIGLAVYGATRAETVAGKAARRQAWPWLVVGLGFFFLSFDEEFQIHEGLREGYFKPHHVLTEVPGFKAGDIVLLFYVLAGVVLCFCLFQDLRRYRRAMLLFFGAVVLIGVLAVQDSLDLRILNRGTGRHVQLLVEEIGEVWAQALFAFSMLSVLLAKLRGLASEST